MGSGRRIGPLAIAAAALALCPSTTGSVVPAGGRGRIQPGRYGGGDVYLNVRPGRETAGFHFTLLCTDPFGNLVGTSGPAPVHGRLSGGRVGARLRISSEHEGPPEGETGRRLTIWGMVGRFTGPREFRGAVEFEVTGIAGRRSRPQCLQRTGVRLLLGTPYARSR
jgi:hypothetical protein